MKRMSIAEQSLKKQIDNCLQQEHGYTTQVKILIAQREAIFSLRQQFEIEMGNLRVARETSKAKP